MALPFNNTQQINKEKSELFYHEDDKGNDTTFADLLNDEEDVVISYAKDYKNSTLNKLSKDDVILQMIEESYSNLRKKYPKGGIKTSRFITAKILLEAPQNYFDKYDNDIVNGISYVRDSLADSGRSHDIAVAQENPTDDAKQDQAYYIVQSMSSEFMDKYSNWRGIHKNIVLSLICNEILGFGKIDPLWRDRSIDEILCNGPKDIQVEIRGELFKVPSCHFRDQQDLMELIERLYRAIGKTLSMTTPLVKGRLHDRSRMFATHPVISPDGPNFSIRRHPAGFWTPQDIIDRGSASEDVMQFIGNMIYKGGSAIVVGGTHSGKTSLLNAITGFYKPKVRILTLEDNLEMKPNPNKFVAAAMECREASPDRIHDKGVKMRDLVKSSLQLRPDTLIIGEITDGSMYDLLSALLTGHSGASTIHANDSNEAIPRMSALASQDGLVTRESAYDLIAGAIDIIIVVKHFPIDGSRRIVSVDEVETEPIEENGRRILRTKPIWKFIDDGLDDNGRVTGHWEQIGKLSQERIDKKMLNLEKDLTWEELKSLSSINDEDKIHVEEK